MESIQGMYVTNMIELLLLETCLICDQQVIAQIENFKRIFTTPLMCSTLAENTTSTSFSASLSKLCTVTIRQHMPNKSSENFDKLGLPPKLVQQVSHGTLSKQLIHMWENQSDTAGMN